MLHGANAAVQPLVPKLMRAEIVQVLFVLF